MQLSYKAALDMLPGQVLRCGIVQGLMLRRRKDERTWWFYYRFQGAQRWLRLGVFPTLSVDGAREAARERARAVARGEDPARAKRDALAAVTIQGLWDEYRRQHIEKKCGPETIKLYDSYWRTHLIRLANRRACEVTLNDVNQWLERIGENAPATANRCRALLWSMYEYAESPSVKITDYGSNPVKRSVRFREARRKRHIRTDEFPAIGDALRAVALVYPQQVAAILCTLLTGSRVSELAKARVWQFDIARNCVVLSDHKTAKRTGEDRVIWLPEQAAAIIRNLPRDRSDYLFGAGLDRYGLRRVWLRVVAQAGCPDVRLQDLRRTFASVAKSRGVGLAEVGEMLGHKQQQTTMRYAFLFEERAAGISQDTGDAISGLLGKPKPESPQS